MPEAGKEIQSVRGILKAEVKTTKNTGASYFQCRVGDVLTNAFQGNTNYSKVESLNGKAVILEYTITSKGKDFIDINLDPNPPETTTTPSNGGNKLTPPEVMTKAEWLDKEAREAWLRLFSMLLKPETFVLLSPNGDIEDLIKIARRLHQVPFPGQSEKAEDIRAEPKIEITDAKFKELVTEMGFDTTAKICEGLGVQDLKQWSLGREIALDKLFQIAKTKGKFTEYKHWRGIK